MASQTPPAGRSSPPSGSDSTDQSRLNQWSPPRIKVAVDPDGVRYVDPAFVVMVPAVR